MVRGEHPDPVQNGCLLSGEGEEGQIHVVCPVEVDKKADGILRWPADVIHFAHLVGVERSK